MKGDCEQASSSPVDKRAPKILTRPRAAKSPSPQRRREQAVPALPAEGSPGDGGTAGSSAGCSLITFPDQSWQTCPPLPSSPQGAAAVPAPARGHRPTSLAVKEHVAGGHTGDSGPSLPPQHPWYSLTPQYISG